jgi:hypothetical protein
VIDKLIAEKKSDWKDLSIRGLQAAAWPVRGENATHGHQKTHVKAEAIRTLKEYIEGQSESERKCLKHFQKDQKATIAKAAKEAKKNDKEKAKIIPKKTACSTAVSPDKVSPVASINKSNQKRKCSTNSKISNKKLVKLNKNINHAGKSPIRTSLLPGALINSVKKTSSKIISSAMIFWFSVILLTQMAYARTINSNLSPCSIQTNPVLETAFSTKGSVGEAPTVKARSFDATRPQRRAFDRAKKNY